MIVSEYSLGISTVSRLTRLIRCHAKKRVKSAVFSEFIRDESSNSMGSCYALLTNFVTTFATAVFNVVLCTLTAAGHRAVLSATIL